MARPTDSRSPEAKSAEPTAQRQNNFDFWRIAAASAVLFSHQFALLGQSQPALHSRITLGWAGVCIFFVISGFLVTQSWQRDPHAGRFALRRFLRIWPGLVAVTLLAVFVLGPAVTQRSLADYFQAPQTWAYFKTLVLNVKYGLPGVFEANPYPHAVNGSLWTISVEVRWYIALLVAGVLGVLRHRALVLAALLVLALYHFGIYGAESNPKTSYLREFGLFFLYGACLQLYRDAWQPRRAALAIGAVLAAAGAFALGQNLVAIWLLLPIAVIVVGLASTPVLRRFARFGDLSYGIYIYAFPMQQLVVWWTGARLSLPITMGLSAGLTVALAFLSWHLVERPALRMKPGRR